MRYSVGSGLGPRCNSRYIRTCCDMAAATPWRTPGMIRGRYRLGSATRTSSTRCVTPSWLLIGLRTSGAENLSSRCRLEPAPYGLNRTAGAGMRGAQPNLAASGPQGNALTQGAPQIFPVAAAALDHGRGDQDGLAPST